MRDQHLLAELMASARCDHFGGDAGQVAIPGSILCAERQRNERGPWIANRQTELARQIVAESGGAHLGDGESAGGYYKRRRAKLGAGGANYEVTSAYFLNCGVQEDQI